MNVDQRVQPQPSMNEQRGLKSNANGMAETGIRSGTAEGTNSNTQMTPQAAGSQGSTYPPNYPPGAYAAPPPNRPSSSGPCCGCMPLKAGCIVIGSINLVLILIAMWTSVVNFVGISSSFNGLEACGRNGIGYFYWMWILLFLWAIAYGLVNVGLIVGASKGNGCMCWTWIAVTGISVFSFLIGNVHFSWGLGFVRIGESVIPYFLQVYFIVVVVFYVKELNGNRQQGQGFMAPQGQPSQPLMSQQYGPYSGNGNAMIVPGTQSKYYGGNPGNYPSTFDPPPPYQTPSQPLMQKSDAGPGQPNPATLAPQS